MLLQWKGRATYFDLTPPSSGLSPKKVASRIWTYETPTDRFIPIKNYLSFYAGASTKPDRGGWKCFVGEEEVQAQDGDVSCSFLRQVQAGLTYVFYSSTVGGRRLISRDE